MQNNNEPLNNAVPASTIIKQLAREKRDLAIENLDLKRRLEIATDDIAELQNYDRGISHKEINKSANSLMNLYAQLRKVSGVLMEVTDATQKLSELLAAALDRASTNNGNNDNDEN